MNILTIDSVDVNYRYAKVIHGASLYLNKGEFVFIVGRNGAGKTTLLKAICGLLKINSGSILYENKKIDTLSAEVRALKGIRFVAQDKKPFSSLTVRENFELAAYAMRVNPKEVIQMAVSSYPKFESLMDCNSGKLSGGQKQLLLIIRALAGNPKIILIDEPSEGLDSISIDNIFKLLENKKGSMSGIIVEQNLSIVSRLADRIYILKEGKIIKEINDNSHIKNTEMYETFL